MGYGLHAVKHTRRAIFAGLAARFMTQLALIRDNVTNGQPASMKAPMKERCLGGSRLTVLLFVLFTTVAVRAQAVPSAGEVYGGDHEFGGVVGYSPVSGPIWGYDENTRYLPVILKYSYLMRSSPRWNLRYSPEVTALAVLSEPAPSLTNPAAPTKSYGSGVSPVGFEIGFRSGRRVQPFASTAGGFIYYNQRVLSPQGSQFMYTIDFGTGVRLYSSPHNALMLGYRYQHFSNANISVHNPGTDADTFYIGFSHFHTHG